MKERLQKLFSVKSIVTILLTLVFCYLAIIEKLSTEFMGVYTTVIALLNDAPFLTGHSTMSFFALRSSKSSSSFRDRKSHTK